MERYREIVTEIMNLKVRRDVLEKEAAAKQAQCLEIINRSQGLLQSVMDDGIELKIPDLFALHEQERSIFTSLNRCTAEIRYMVALLSERENELREIKNTADSSLDLLKTGSPSAVKN
jgi:hypothetical protein